MHVEQTVVLVLACAGFWFGGAALIARLAGWHRISALYPARADARGEDLAFCTVGLGTAQLPMTYKRCVRVLLSEQGLGLRLMRPFRFQSPPVFIPWQAVAACTVEQALLTQKVVLALQGTDRRIVFRGPLGQLVQAAYRTHGPAAPV